MTAPLGSRPVFGWPNILCPDACGPLVEDVWPSMYAGVERVSEMRRKIESLPWAARALERWRAEAEAVLEEEPRFTRQSTGGRVGMIVQGDGTHLLFDPRDPECAVDPRTGERRAMNALEREGWGILQHERVRRLMSSLGFLWRLTGDERYARWVWAGMRQAVDDLYHPGRLETSGEGRVKGEQREKGYSLVYGGLYEAQAQLQFLQAFELVEGAPGGTEELAQSVRQHVLTAGGETLSRWMKVMDVHNMSCWGSAALGLLGRKLGRREWIDQALHSERAGLRTLLLQGVPKDDRSGAIDGFWFETSSFYHFYAAIPLLPLFRLAEQEGVVDEELRGRLRALLEAPLQLVDAGLRFVTVGDRSAAGQLSLAQYRHVYEFAAGQVDAERFGPALATLYETTGATREHLSALAYGPDDLPAPGFPARKHAVLPSARMAVFRGAACGQPLDAWFLAGEDNAGGQGHHHHDKLSISLHAGGEPVAADQGLTGFSDSVWTTFLNGTLSHHTLLLDETDQGPMRSLAFETGLQADVPWAYGCVEGDREGARGKLWKVMQRRGDEVREGVYDGARLARTVFFGSDFVALADRLEASGERRCGFVFHARGALQVHAERSSESASALPALPNTGVYGLFTARQSAAGLAHAVADWRLGDGGWLRLCVTCDAPFELTWGRTPGNPAALDRGTILARALGNARTFGAALEFHRGSPTLVRVERDATGLTLHRYHGTQRRLALPEVAAERFPK
ncbi:MAG: heparinase II/III family protein [Planctomycetes bacterium]|nr:heparinase II/III family protein [Planctomycetota bacterium]